MLPKQKGNKKYSVIIFHLVLLNERQHMKTNTENKFILKHGALYISKLGLTSDKKYARTYTLKEAMKIKRNFAKQNVFLDVVEI